MKVYFFFERREHFYSPNMQHTAFSKKGILQKYCEFVLDHCNKMNVTKKLSHMKFCFPNAYKCYSYTIL